MSALKIRKPDDVLPYMRQVLALVNGASGADCSTRLKTAYIKTPPSDPEFVTGFWQLEQSTVEARRADYSNLLLDDRSMSTADALDLISRLVAGPTTPQGMVLPKFHTPSVNKHLGRWGNERTEFSGWPEWVFSFSPERKNGGQVIPPSEPVVGRGLRPYGSGVQAVLDWVWGRREPETHVPHSDSLIVVIPDYRCRIRSAEWRRGKVTALVEGPEEHLELQMLVHANGSHTAGPPVTGVPRGEALDVPVPAETERVELFLVRATGELASHVVLHSAGEEFEAKPGRPTAEEQAIDDLRNGEGQQVEFKPFIEPKNPKESEVVESLVAFSNTEGGRLYIGVTKHGIPEGEVAMRRAAKADGETAARKLVDWVKQLGTEKVKPDPELQVQVVRVAGEVVLVATVAPGNGCPYSTHANDVFIRSGATNRKPDPRTELPNIGNSRRGAYLLASGV